MKRILCCAEADERAESALGWMLPFIQLVSIPVRDPRQCDEHWKQCGKTTSVTFDQSEEMGRWATNGV